SLLRLDPQVVAAKLQGHTVTGNRFRRGIFPLDSVYVFFSVITNFDRKAGAALSIGAVAGRRVDKYVRRVSRFERFVCVVLCPLGYVGKREGNNDDEHAEAFHSCDSFSHSTGATCTSTISFLSLY